MTNPHPTDRGNHADNLRPPLTHEEAVERGRRGGIQNGKNWAARRLLKEIALDVLDEQDRESPEGSDVTNALAIMRAIAERAKKGDVSSAVFIRDTSGQKPVDKVENETTINGAVPALVEFVDGKGETVKSV